MTRFQTLIDFILTECMIMDSAVFLYLSFFLFKMVIIMIPISYSCCEDLLSVIACKVLRRTSGDYGLMKVANPLPPKQVYNTGQNCQRPPF